MVDFKTLKKTSGDLTRLAAELDKINNPKSERQADERFWKPTVDKAGNGYAVIRFLAAPAVDGDDALPWVRVFSHGFKGPTGRWFIENSLTTLGLKDPVSDFNSELWNSTTDDDSPARKQARTQKRKLGYIANIMVVTDQSEPENEGKVFLYKFGKKIFDKVSQAMNPGIDEDGNVIPGEEDTEGYNPFDFWAGADFKLKIRQVSGYRNYDKSEFAKPKAIFDKDKEIEEIWKSEFSLKEFIDPNSDNYKSYEKLEEKLYWVLDVNRPEVNATPERRDTTPITESVPESPTDSTDTDGEDDDLDVFKNLADA
jgi:hypothetical protein